MATTIKLKNGSGAPLAGDLVQGEPALDLTNKRLYTEDSGGTVIEVGTNPSTLTVDTTTLVVDASNNRVGVGTASPDGTFHVKDAIAQVYIQSNDGQPAQVVFGDVSDASGGMVEYTSSNEMTFKTNNLNERMRIDSSGNVGINTTSPQRTFHVSSGATNVVARLESTDSVAVAEFKDNAGTVEIGCSGNDVILAPAGVERMRIDSSGNVGIGTTSPDSKLQITTGTNNIIQHRDATHSTLTNVTSAITFSRTDGIDDLSAIMGWNDGGVALSGREGIAFATGGGVGYSATVERMRIDSSGRVGIGTTGPSNMLHISSSDPTIRLQDTDATGYCLINAASNSRIQIKADEGNNDANTTIEFHVDATERMRIDSSGRVGINRSSPNGLFHMQSTSGTDSAFYIQTGAATDDSVIYFGDDSASQVGSILYEHSSNSLQFASNGTERMRIDSSGSLMVGISATYSTPVVGIGGSLGGGTGVELLNNSGVSWIPMRFHTASNLAGYISSTTTTTAYVTSSDVRLKENIVDAPAGNIDAIRVRSFDWKVDGSHQTYGMVAQELVDVAPEAVTQGETEDDMWGVDYSKLVPMMIKEIQDLKAEVAALKGA